jgi:hypothetical protein
MFRPCRFSRLRRLAPRMCCRSVAPCCRPWGSPGCWLPTWVPPSPCTHGLRCPRPVSVTSTRKGRRGSPRTVGGSVSRAFGSRRPRSTSPTARSCDHAAGCSTRAHRTSLLKRPHPKMVLLQPPRCLHREHLDVAIQAASSRVDRLPAPCGQPANRSAGTGRPTFAVATLPPPHEVGSDPPALTCLRAVLSGAVPFEAFPSSTARLVLGLLPDFPSMLPWPCRPAVHSAAPGHPGRFLLAVAVGSITVLHRSGGLLGVRSSTSRLHSVSESVAVPALARWFGPMLPWALSCCSSTSASPRSEDLGPEGPGGAAIQKNVGERIVPGRLPEGVRSDPSTRAFRRKSERPLTGVRVVGRVDSRFPEGRLLAA